MDVVVDVNVDVGVDVDVGCKKLSRELPSFCASF